MKRKITVDAAAERILAAACLFLLAAAGLLLLLPSPLREAAAEASAPESTPEAAAAVSEPTSTPYGGSAAYDPSELTGRAALLSVARSQLGSDGRILSGGVPTEVYYTQWYVGGEYFGGWDEKTPWCGAFVSWAAAQTQAVEHFTAFANVEDGAARFADGTNGAWLTPEEPPCPGDLVFFDWDEEGAADHGAPDHVGIVLRVRDGELTVIEGNSGGSVTEKRYAPDSAAICGYGVLAWEKG